MPLISIGAVYLVVWWLCLFIMLPLGAHSQHDAGEVVHGSEPGAPALLRLWPKLLATTLLAAVLTGLLLWGLTNPALREYWR